MLKQNKINYDAIISFLRNSDFNHSDKDCLLQADYALAGKWVTDKFFRINTDLVDFDTGNIDWDVQATKSPNTFSLSLHCLLPAFFLAIAYHNTSEEKYLDFALNIVDSWEAYSKKLQSKLNRYTWYDHSVACRIRVFVLLECIASQKNKTIRSLTNLIQAHAKWLEIGSNYTQKHNHGIMQDFGLLTAGYWLSNKSYIDTSVKRLIEQFAYAFPNKFAHVENSIGYNSAMLRFLFASSDFLQVIDSASLFVTQIDSYKDGACFFMTHTTMPNTLFPSIGDTFRAAEGKSASNTLLPLMKQYATSGTFANLHYAVSGGKRGSKPRDTFKVFPKDGYAFWRSSWDEENPTWAMLNSGFLSITHKHKDELSFNLFAKGHEIFIDPGAYNYMVGSTVHDYLNSVFAHNGVIVDNNDYAIGKNVINRAGLFEPDCYGKINSATAYNNMYPGVYITRTVLFVCENEFYLIDDIFSEVTHVYSQNFHLSNNVSIVRHKEEDSVLKITGTDFNIIITQHQPAEEATQKHGETGSVKTMSVMSVGLNQLVPTTSIQFSKKAASTQFITKISITKESQVEIPIVKGKEGLTVNGTSYSVSPYKRPTPSLVAVKFTNGKIEIYNQAATESGFATAYYLLDKQTGQTVASTKYAYGKAVISLKSDGAFVLRAYVRTKNNETIFYNAGELDTGKKHFFSTILGQEIPVIHDRVCEGGGNKFTFKLIHKIPWDVTVSWYVYKNGAGYDYTAGKSVFNYTFTEPGMYTVIYRCNVKYFYEIELGNFPEIEISENMSKGRNTIRFFGRALRGCTKKLVGRVTR